MPYDPEANAYHGNTRGFYQSAEAITPSNDNDLPEYGPIVALEAGDVTFIPARNDDADPITMELTVGQIPPFIVRRVLATGTTASVALVGKRFG